MAFKTLDEYNGDKYRDFFVLPNDGDSADVIFLYRGTSDVMIGDMHYIKSADYSGYVHCCGNGCPACGKGIRVQSKILIPVYVISEDKIKYFDRTTYFEPQLMADVFNRYPDPSQCVFRITRHGEARSRDTRYDIVAKGRNGVLSYDEILARFNTTMPEDYSRVAKEFSAYELSEMLSNSGSNDSTNATANLEEYIATPRVAVSAPVSQPVDASMPPITTVIDAPVTKVNTAADVTPVEGGDSTEELDNDDVLF